MDENQIQQEAANRFTDKPFEVVITYKDLTRWQRLLIWLKLKPAKLRYVVKPITLGNFERIAPVINRIPDNILQQGILKSFTENGHKYLDDFIYLIAVGIKNKKSEPSPAFLKLLKDETSWEDIAMITEQIMHQLGTHDFIRSTVLMKGTEILTTGPMTGKIIAPETLGEASEDLPNISD